MVLYTNKNLTYTHRRHRNVRLLSQSLHHPLHNGGDSGGSRAAGGCHGDGGHSGRVAGGVDRHLHQMVHHLLHHRRDVEGRVASLIRDIDHGGDDGGRGVIVLVLKNRGQVVIRRHLLRAPLHMLPQSHHKNLEGVVVLRSENALNMRIFH